MRNNNDGYRKPNKDTGYGIIVPYQNDTVSHVVRHWTHWLTDKGVKIYVCRA